MKIIILLAAAAACYILFYPDAASTADPIDHASARHGMEAAPAHNTSKVLPGHAGSWLNLPFGNFAANAVDKSKLVQERKERMKKNGYYTPEEYFFMPLAELQVRAKSKDLYALLQLGQQYYFESNSLQYEDGFDFHGNPKEMGKHYLAEAAVGGHAHMTAVMIKLHSEEGNPLAAYSWQLFGQRMGDTYETAVDISRLNAGDIEKAKVLATELSNRSLQRVAATNSAVGIQ